MEQLMELKHVFCTAMHILLTIPVTCRHNELHCRTYCRTCVPHLQQCLVNVVPVLSCSVAVCQGPCAVVSRCSGVPSSSAVDVSRVGGRWMFAKLSPLPRSKSVWADGQTEESTANPTAAGSATSCSVLNEADFS